MDTLEVSHSKLIPLTQWPNIHSYPPLGTLRWLVFHEEFNGFKDVIRRLGRRILIDESAFFEWAKTQGGRTLSGKKR